MATVTATDIRLVHNIPHNGVHIDATSLTVPPVQPLEFDAYTATTRCGLTAPMEQGRWEWVGSFVPGALCWTCLRGLDAADVARVHAMAHRGGA